MKKRKRFFDETDSDETDLSPRKKFRVNTYNSVLDCLSNELHKRACAYDEITKMFGFLSDFESMSLEELLSQIELVTHMDSTDVEKSLVDEFLCFKDMISQELDSVFNMARMLRSQGGFLASAFPNLAIIIRIFLTLPCSNKF